MANRYSPALQAFALAGAFLLIDAGNRVAQAETIDVLIELARNDAPQDIIALRGTELSSILDAATAAERAELMALLPVGDADALLAALSGNGASPALVADVIVAGVNRGDMSDERLTSEVQQNSPPVALPAISAALVAEAAALVAVSGSVNPAVIASIINIAIALDPRPGTISDIIGVANGATAVNGPEAIGRALALIADTATPQLASAIETAVAISGDDRLAQAFSAAAGVPPVADIPTPAPIPAAPPVPVVAPSVVGGGGASGGGANASRTGEDFIAAAGGAGGGGLGGDAGGFTRTTDNGTGPVVSP